MIAPPDRIPLASGLLLLRWRTTDAERLTRAIAESRDHLRPWMPWAGAAALEEQRAVLERWERGWDEGADLTYGLFLGPLVVGSAGLHRRIGPDGLEIGYWVHAAHTRRGHASSAAAALTTVAFSLPGIAVVEIHHDRANVASEGVPRKLGFTLVGDHRRPPAAPGETGVLRIWRMTGDRWRPPSGPGDPPEDPQTGEITSPVGTLG
jgi:RimJ/RimL family protein N-acetyltransferase